MTNREALLNRIRALEGDAERYRWLRDHSANQYEHPLVVSQTRTDYGVQYIGPLTGKSLDAAIDRAIGVEMNQTKKNPGWQAGVKGGDFRVATEVGDSV